MPQTVAKLSCESCGKNYAWKPQYAGRTLKCTCGAMIKAPAAAPTESTSTARRPAPAPAPAAPPPPDISAADEFERMLAGGYDVSSDAPPPPPPSNSRYKPVGAPAAATSASNKGTAYSQARPVEYESQKSGKSFNILSSPIFVALGSLVLTAGIIFLIVGILRTVKPAQKHIYQTSRNVTTFEGTKVIKKQIGPDEMLDANGNVVKKPVAKEVDFRTVEMAKPGQEETADQKRIRRYREDAQKRDAELQKLIETPKKVADAREWLKPENATHQGSPSQDKEALMKKVENLYAAGAKKVWVSDLSGIGSKSEFCNSFIIEMPEDFDTRKKVLAARAEIRPDMDTIDWSNNFLKFPCESNPDRFR